MEPEPVWARVHTFRALRNYNFRLFWTGQLVSLIGTWIHRTANAWLVLKLTGSPMAVGLVSTMQFLPTLLLGLLTGWVADRFDRRRTLLLTQSCAALVALLLGVLTSQQRLDLATLAALALALGLVHAVDAPVRHAFLAELVGREDVPNAVALHSAVFNAARIAGPGLAGLIIARTGFAACFYLNALSYLAAIAALLRMRPELIYRRSAGEEGYLAGPGEDSERAGRAAQAGETSPGSARLAARQPGLWAELREGFEYAWRTRDVRMVIGLMAVVGTFSFNFNVLLPILAERTLGWDAVRYGLLFSALGAGSLAGALLVATLSRTHRGMVLAGALGLFLGKQVGVMSAAWLATVLKIGKKPSRASWLQVYGVSLLCGVGFTMSLFIGALAFPGAVDSPEQVEVKLGVIGGSLMSGIAAAIVLAIAASNRRAESAAPSIDTDVLPANIDPR